MTEAGVECVVLHGCVGKDEDGQLCDHVYGPRDSRRTCPKCGHHRYQEDGSTPNEKVYHFPIHPRLKALMQLESFRKLLQVTNSPFIFCAVHICFCDLFVYVQLVCVCILKLVVLYMH